MPDPMPTIYSLNGRTAEIDRYYDFLRSKIDLVERRGFDIDEANLHPSLFLHQKDVIRWATRLGRGLLAMSFGLGKTRIQCELARNIHRSTSKRFLIVCPLGVKYQFQKKDGPVLGMRWQYVRNDEEIRTADTPYLITNYERVREGNITPSAIAELGGVSLDEGSVLRSLDSKTSDVFCEVFAPVPYRFVATATPAPNEYKEIIYYARWLGITDHGLILTKYFKRNTTKAGQLVLMESREKEFWLWVASWALFLYRPSDLGYSDEGYELPELRVHWHRIKADHTRAFSQTDNRGQHRLFLDAASPQDVG